MIKLKFIPDYFPIILMPLYCVIVKIKYCIKKEEPGYSSGLNSSFLF